MEKPMNDKNTTVEALKCEIINLCRRKGWGEDGIQHPQHICMAMMVEACEVLEHFMDMTPEAETALMSGGEIAEKQEIAEEIADVLMYGLQIMYTLGVDVSAGFGSAHSDAQTPVAELRAGVDAGEIGPVRRAMHISFAASKVLERFQYMPEADVQALIRHEKDGARREIGVCFVRLFSEILALSNIIDFDVAASIARKIAIVDRRVYAEDEPKR
jgi:NTP pyrophosphatase (non-canonical NTP hydrolase)